MRSLFVLAALALAAVLSSGAPAHADCTCAPRDFAGNFAAAQNVLRVRVAFEWPRAASASTRRFTARLLAAPYKGCGGAAGDQLDLYVPNDDRECLPALSPGRELLVFGTLQYGRGPVPSLWIPPCSGSVAFRALSASEQSQLAASHPICSGACPGSGVTCPLDPCTLTRCEVAGATCRADTCQCRPIWLDAESQPVCTDRVVTCDWDDPRRWYYEIGPERCRDRTIECPAGESRFSDACGCGCERADERTPS